MSPNEIDELQTQIKLNKCIDTFESFRFNAGAGAGKTYAVVETINYIIKNKLKELKNKNQQVICITYTNVAVREIKARLGSSDIALISTIHDRLWDVVKPYQQELVRLHFKKLQDEVKAISQELSDKNNKKLKKYTELTDTERNEFTAFAIANRKIYTNNRVAGAAAFKAAYDEVDDKPSCFSKLISSAENFKEVVKRLYKLERYGNCIQEISDKKKNKVEYDSAFNADRLEYMKFSHDTLLEYSEVLFNNYPILQRIVVDKYPYFFIDEYQDTNIKVIKIVANLYRAAKKNKKNWLVGYFGDTAQNIYDEGVGIKIASLHPEVADVDKIFNRRSHKQIIDVINRIRSDNICQKPIFEDRTNGKLQFYYSSNVDNREELSRAFLSQYKADLIAGDEVGENKIHCLVLTNKLMAELSQFGDIHKAVAGSTIFFNEIKTKLLSHDIEKLHPTILLLYRIVKLHGNLLNKNATFGDVLGKNVGKISFSKAYRLFEAMKNINASSINDLIDGFSIVLKDKSHDGALQSSLWKNLSIRTSDMVEAKDLREYLNVKVRELMIKDGDQSSHEEAKNIEIIQSFMAIDINQWHRWVDFIDRKVDGKDVIFHTYHGTKGEEYENVAILMEHSFGGTQDGKDKLKKYFLKVAEINWKQTNVDLESEIDSEFENTKNLLYVACSRAIKSLRILYIDEIEDIRNGVESIFGEVVEWKMPS